MNNNDLNENINSNFINQTNNIISNQSMSSNTIRNPTISNIGSSANISINTEIKDELNTYNNSNLKGLENITLMDVHNPKPLEDMPYTFCPRCNCKVTANSKFCSSCGNQVSR